MFLKWRGQKRHCNPFDEEEIGARRQCGSVGLLAIMAGMVYGVEVKQGGV